MNLFHVEYENKSGLEYVCNVVGDDETQVIQDLVSQVGQIRILSLSRGQEIHRITGSIRKRIIDHSQKNEPQRGKGRPRKLDW